MSTEWYAKPMASGRFLDFLSNHPLHMKMNVVNNFIKRVRELSTNLTDQEVGRIIDQQLALNHYPRPLRHRLINRRNRQREVAETSASEVSYKPLVHVEHLTNRLKKLLKKDYPDIVLATRNRRTVETFFTNTKDVIPPAMKTNIIYRIPCNSCDASYVGLTTTTLKQRLSNHQSDTNKLNKLLERNPESPTTSYELLRLKEKTALLQHCLEKEHRFAFERTKILDQHRRCSALPILEVCHIVNTDQTVNKRSDVDYLSSQYAGVLHTIKNQRSKHNDIEREQQEPPEDDRDPT